MIKEKGFHFSVDDVFKSLIEVSDKNIPLKKHWFFKQLYDLWKKNKIQIGCNIFYQGLVNGKRRNLGEVKSIKDQSLEKKYKK